VPVSGLVVAAGGHTLARRIPGGLSPSDPDERGWLSVEGRSRLFGGDLDVHAGLVGEVGGRRPGTPVGDLPAFSRLSARGGITLDRFDVMAEVRNFAGTGRVLPVALPDGSPLADEDARFTLRLRWTFWD